MRYISWCDVQGIARSQVPERDSQRDLRSQGWRVNNISNNFDSEYNRVNHSSVCQWINAKFV